MYMPNLVPCNVHHLWLDNRDDTSTSNLPALAAYSSEEPGAADTADSEHTVAAKLRRLKEIRTLGYAYLAPLGIGKTMLTLSEELENRRQVEEQHEDNSATSENLMGEGGADNNNNNNNNNIANDGDGNGDNNAAPVEELPEADTEAIQPVGLALTMDPLDVDLDAAIPDEDNSSYNSYDEARYETEYDQDFMVSEEYAEDEPAESSSTAQVEGITAHHQTSALSPHINDVNNDLLQDQNFSSTSMENSMIIDD